MEGLRYVYFKARITFFSFFGSHSVYNFVGYYNIIRDLPVRDKSRLIRGYEFIKKGFYSFFSNLEIIL